MRYILKNYDTPLMVFDMSVDCINGLTIQYIESFQEHQKQFPLDLTLTNEGIEKWLRKRVIPKNRAFVHEILKALNLSYNDLKGIIDVCKGLSLNDSYWIVPTDFDGKYTEYNLYENKFSSVLSLVAYTGIGGGVTPFTTSPELTTNGMLAKSWRTVKGDIYLYKAGTEGFANTGKEPYSEFYAYQIAKAMGLDAVYYNLGKWKGKLCSICPLFTDIHTAYVPIGRIVTEGGMKAVMEYYRELGEEYYQQLASMIVFDAVICNEDRHFGNFGILRDNRTGEILKPAPIFDNGLSLFNYAMDDDFEDISVYAQTRRTADGVDHVERARVVMGAKQREQLRHLLNFRFERHATYNLPAKRLKKIEAFVQERARELLRD